MSKWPIVKLGDVCDLMTGGTPDTKRPEYYVGGQIPWLVSGDINRVEIIECQGRITEEGLNNSNARWLPQNSVMIALAGQGKTRGTVAMLRIEATCNQSMVAMIPKDRTKLMAEYVFWNLRSRYIEIRRLSGDDERDRRGLNMQMIRSIQIPLPPLDEQKRIVAKLDRLSEAVKSLHEACRSRARAQDALKQRAVAELLQDVARTSGERRLGEIFDIARGGSPRPIKEFLTQSPDGVNWIRISDATRSGKYITETQQKIRPEGVSRSRLVRSGDFLLSNSMSFGRPYILQTEGCIHDGWLVLQRRMDAFDIEYMYYALGSDQIYRQFDARAQGSTVRNLNIESASTVMVPFPDFAEQEKLAARFQQIDEQIMKTSTVLDAKVTALHEYWEAHVHVLLQGAG